MSEAENIELLLKDLDSEKQESMEIPYNQDQSRLDKYKKSFKEFTSSKADMTGSGTLLTAALTDVTMTYQEVAANSNFKECNFIADFCINNLGAGSLYPLGITAALAFMMPAAFYRNKASRGLLYTVAAMEVLVATYMSMKHYTDFPGYDLC